MNEGNLAAMSINVSSVQMLTGTDSDLNSPDYLYIKHLLTEERKFIKTSRVVYLVGQKPDGILFFYADSEPDTSPDYSPPGQVYQEASTTFRPAFAGKSLITGPWTDQWGTWMAAMIPLPTPVDPILSLPIQNAGEAILVDSNITKNTFIFC